MTVASIKPATKTTIDKLTGAKKFCAFTVLLVKNFMISMSKILLKTTNIQYF
jgi:hypothetical protein